MPGADVGAVAPCIQDEADTRLFLHVVATTVAGHRRVIVRTIGSDAVLGIITFVALRQQIGEFWIAFEMRQPHRYIPMHNIVIELRPSKALALPVFHVLTGCDTTLVFFGNDKKTALSVWQPLPELTLPLQLP